MPGNSGANRVKPGFLSSNLKRARWFDPTAANLPKALRSSFFVVFAAHGENYTRRPSRGTGFQPCRCARRHSLRLSQAGGPNVAYMQGEEDTTMSSADTLRDLVSQKIGNALFVVVSNREPYTHSYKNGRIECQRPASGMATGLEPVVRATHGLWVAHGSGNADRAVVDEHDKVQILSGAPAFTLKRVWLTKSEEDHFYHGFANRTMWPLCHVVFVRPTFEQADWEAYQMVNEKFAAAVLEEIGDERAFVWIQDFHLSLLPRLLKEARPELMVAQFWHVPWPTPEIFRLCPWKTEILKGLLANDLLGFHLRHHCDNFLETVDRELEVRVDRERSSVFSSGHETQVRRMPISIDFDHTVSLAGSEAVRKTMTEFHETLGIHTEFLILGVDRFDYTKGIPERIRALDRFFEKYPEYLGRVTLLQAGPVSRVHVKEYKELNDRVNALVEEVNWKHGFNSWQPIILTKGHRNEVEMIALYKMADVALVSSLHDGMNLIAKEFVAARTDGGGVLVLSKFTGAARELEQATLINPYDTEDFADALKKALEMPEADRREDLSKMQEVIREQNIYYWAEQFVSQLSRLA
jgi:alpha,alpha-trehalose-phosphate synthase [UDP-forming]